MCDLVFYVVGCMFGCYFFDQLGLILVNQSEIVEDYLKQILELSFLFDEDNVILVFDGEWFIDDIIECFCEFLCVVFGEEYYEENFCFVEQVLGKNICKYFLNDFYSDYVCRYKKCFIYWLFFLFKGLFNVLIYMYCYCFYMVSVVLKYFCDFKDEKFLNVKQYWEEKSISKDVMLVEKINVFKKIEKINKMFIELDEYERNVFYFLVIKQVEIDFDNGVKENYFMFGFVLKKIIGLS